VKSLYKVLYNRYSENQKFFRVKEKYALIIKSRLKDIFPDVRVLIFGSAVKKENLPWSDIDIMIISEFVPDEIFEQNRIKVEKLREFLNSPFEFHFLKSETFENWYKKFLKNSYIEL